MGNTTTADVNSLPPFNKHLHVQSVIVERSFIVKAITDEEFESLVDVYDLTDQELVGVGFNKLGVRKKMLRIFQKAKAEMEIGVIANNSNAAQSQSQSQEAQAQGLDPNWSVVYYRGKNRTVYLVKPSSDSVSICRWFVLNLVVATTLADIKSIRAYVDNNTKSDDKAKYVRYYVEEPTPGVYTWPYSSTMLVLKAIQSLKKANLVTVHDESFKLRGFGGFPCYSGVVDWKAPSSGWNEGTPATRQAMFRLMKRTQGMVNWRSNGASWNDTLNMESLGLLAVAADGERVAPDFNLTLAEILDADQD